jgi:hypothetical protein
MPRSLAGAGRSDLSGFQSKKKKETALLRSLDYGRLDRPRLDRGFVPRALLDRLSSWWAGPSGFNWFGRRLRSPSLASLDPRRSLWSSALLLPVVGFLFSVLLLRARPEQVHVELIGANLTVISVCFVLELRGFLLVQLVGVVIQFTSVLSHQVFLAFLCRSAAAPCL